MATSSSRFSCARAYVLCSCGRDPLPAGFLSAIHERHVAKQYVDYLPQVPNLPQVSSALHAMNTHIHTPQASTSTSDANSAPARPPLRMPPQTCTRS
jgi:hypothetical protein